MQRIAVTKLASPEVDRAGRWARLVFWVLAYTYLFHVLLKVGSLAAAAPEDSVIRTDFAAFWAAARLALADQALTAFDPPALLAASQLPDTSSKDLLWLYPPHFLAAIAPLGALPYWAAWSVFVLISATALGLAARAPARPLPGGWRLIVVSPLLLMAVYGLGQTSVLWTAGLIAALWSMRHGQSATAGFWLALLTIKPQLGLLIPVALIAERRWATIAWATGFSIVAILIATLMFGAAYWLHFLAGVADINVRLESGALTVARQVSFYGLARNIGFDHDTATWLHWPAVLAVAFAVAWVWRRDAIGADLKAATLCAVIPLASHYAYYYEMTVTLAAGLFLMRDGFGRTLGERLWLLVLWFGPIPALYTPALTQEVTFLGVPILLITTGLCLSRAWHRTQRSLD